MAVNSTVEKFYTSSGQILLDAVVIGLEILAVVLFVGTGGVTKPTKSAFIWNGHNLCTLVYCFLLTGAFLPYGAFL